MGGSNALKSVQMGLVIFVTQTGVGVIMVPTSLARVAGHDGWISVILTGLAIVIISMLIILLLKRYQDKDIYDINKCIFGKIIGTGLNSLLVLYLLISAIGGAGLFNYFIRITLLPKTPSWALSPFIILPTFYLVWQGLKSMSRFLFCSLISYVIVFVFFIFLYREIRPTFILPVGEAGIISILSGVKVTFSAFIGFEALAFFYPYVTDKKNILKWNVWANLASLIFFLFVVGMCTSIFGENLLQILLIPFFNLSRIINAPIIERVDLYLIALWFIPIACSLRTYVFACYDGMQKVFRLKKTRLTYVLFFGLILSLSLMPRDINQVFWLIELISEFGMGVTAFLILCLILSFIRKKGVNSR